MKILQLLIVSIFVISGCGKKEDYNHHEIPKPPEVPERFPTIPPQPKFSEKFSIIEIAKDKKIDVLWVVDNSGSMDRIQQNIVTNSGIFMDSFKNHKFLEWKMGVMSTDKDQMPFLGFSKPFNHKSPSPVITFERAVDSLGTNGSASEYLFYNVLRAKTTPALETFFRDDAHLAVILVTDEEEQSEDDFGARYEAITFLNQVKGMMRPDKVLRFYGAFQMTDLKNCPQGNYLPAYKDSPLEKVITETGGMAISACILDFGTKLAQIGSDIVSLLKKPAVLIDKRPKIETIKVSYKKQLLKGGPEADGGIWYYDKYFSAIRFYTLDFAPDFDEAEIHITFDINDGINRP